MRTPVLNAETSGPECDVPTLVLVHGVAGGLHIWDPVFDELAKDFRTVRFDLLGYGHSPKPHVAYTPGTHIAAIRRTLHENGLKPPYAFVGLSMGATLVLEYARCHPDEVSALVMIGYPYYPDRRAAEKGLRGNMWTGLTIAHPLIARIYIPFVWWLGRVGLIPPRTFAGIYSTLQARETLLNPYRVFRSNVWNCMVNVDAGVLLEASAEKPRLFIHGGRDAWAQSGRVGEAVTRYPRSRFVEVPGAEHNLVVLEPARTVAAIRDFLS